MLDYWWNGVPALTWAQRNDRQNIVVAVFVSLVLTFYYFFQLTAGTYGPLIFTTNYYDLLCEGFRHGHLYVPTVPKPELLAKPNPFDFDNMPLWLWDASLYKKHYFMYWGPVPGLFLLLWKLLTGTTKEIIDQWIGYPFVLGRLYAGAALIVSFANYSRTRQRPWVVALAILSFALASPTPFTVARMHVYETSLIAGQCFLLGGLYAALWAITHESRRTLLLILASTSWGLAMGSHVATAIAVPLLMLSTTFILWYRNDRSSKTAFRYLLALGVPATCFVLMHAWYNYARFDSFTEFGMTYQVTKQRFTFSSKYVLPNLFAYSFTELSWSCRFPFGVAPPFRKLSPLIHWPSGYMTFERAAGMFPTAIITWLLGFLLWRLVAELWRRARSRYSNLQPNLSSLEVWMLLSVMANVLSLWPALGDWEASVRYLGDAISGFLLASLLAGFWILRMVDFSGSQRLRVLCHLGFATLAIHTCFVGAFSGIATYTDAWQKTNPKLYKKLEEKLSLCPATSKP